MKKIIFLVVICAICALGSWYYLDSQKTVSDIFLYKLTPPLEENTVSGKVVSKPNFKISQLSYQDFDVAIEKEESAFKKYRKDLFAKFENEKFSEDDDFLKQAKINAYKELLAEEWFIISLSHKKSFDAESVLSIARKKGLLSKEVLEYAKENGIEVKSKRLD